ncbi:MAG: glycosyltransferase [Opitutales bacterium]|nr:glycosyltransferase [Opitutales bacterium]
MSLPRAEKISIVIPCFNEAENIRRSYDALTSLDLEIETIFFADDGSTDDSGQRIRELRDPRVIHLAFPHIGKEAALLRGIRAALGGNADYIATADADGQDPPELLPELFRAVSEEGFELANARCRSRGNAPLPRRLLAKIAYALAPAICKIRLVDGARDFRLMTRETAQKIAGLPEHALFLKGQIQAMNFKTRWVEFDFIPRASGTSRWSFLQLLRYTLKGAVLTRRAVKSARSNGDADPKK